MGFLLRTFGSFLGGAVIAALAVQLYRGEADLEAIGEPLIAVLLGAFAAFLVLLGLFYFGRMHYKRRK